MFVPAERDEGSQRYIEKAVAEGSRKVCSQQIRLAPRAVSIMRLFIIADQKRLALRAVRIRFAVSLALDKR